MWTLGTPPLELVARAAIIYVVFFGALRLFGKREIGQFTLFDLALVLLAANALQPAVTGPDASIPGGLIVILTLFISIAASPSCGCGAPSFAGSSSSDRRSSGAMEPGCCPCSSARASTSSTSRRPCASTAWTRSRT